MISKASSNSSPIPHGVEHGYNGRSYLSLFVCLSVCLSGCNVFRTISRQGFKLSSC